MPRIGMLLLPLLRMLSDMKGIFHLQVDLAWGDIYWAFKMRIIEEYSVPIGDFIDELGKVGSRELGCLVCTENAFKILIQLKTYYTIQKRVIIYLSTENA